MKSKEMVEDIANRIVPVGEIPDYKSIVVYGRSGTGKTTFIGTAPKPLLILDIRDKGTISIRNRPETYVLPVTRWEDFEQVYWYLVGKGAGRFATIGIDTVTQLQDMAVRYVVGSDEGPISRRAWGEVASLMKTWIINYRDLEGVHKIFTAQDRISETDEFEEEGTILPEVGPYVMPSVAKTLTAAVDIVGQTFIREREKKIKLKKGGEKTRVITEYCMRIGPHARYLTKLRRDPIGAEEEVPSVLVNPTFEDLVNLSSGNGGN